MHVILSNQGVPDNKNKSMSDKHNKVNRRQFMGQCAHTLGSMSIMGLLLGSYSRQSVSTPAWAIRPPGAIAEDD